jgi:hypothetical protein
LEKLEEKAVSASPVGLNVKHDRTAVVNNKAYLTSCSKSVLYALDSLLDLLGKIISISS